MFVEMKVHGFISEKLILDRLGIDMHHKKVIAKWLVIIIGTFYRV
jgi:hypothetical protein